MTDDIKQEILKDLEEQIFDIPKENFSNKRKWIMQLIKAHLDDFSNRIREDERRKVYVDIKVKFDAWLIMPTLDADKMSRSIYKYLVEKVNSLTTKS